MLLVYGDLPLDIYFPAYWAATKNFCQKKKKKKRRELCDIAKDGCAQLESGVSQRKDGFSLSALGTKIKSEILF